jgi:hypothetical protein
MKYDIANLENFTKSNCEHFQWVIEHQEKRFRIEALHRWPQESCRRLDDTSFLTSGHMLIAPDSDHSHQPVCRE